MMPLVWRILKGWLKKGENDSKRQKHTSLPHRGNKKNIMTKKNQLKAPTNVTELCSFLGIVTYLGKFTSNLSQKVKPLVDLQKVNGFGVISSEQPFCRLSTSLVTVLL